MHDNKRRQVLKNSGVLISTSLLGLTGLNAMASEHKHQNKMMHSRAVAIDASQEGVCATCRYWGGQRRVSQDKEKVYCESLGWCNNPESHNYQTTTTPITGPMKAWRKWEAL